MTELRIGTRLSKRYLIQRRIGEGGMAVVYCAWDEIRQLPVAVKVIKLPLTEDSVALKRFKRETESLSRLSHSNVVRFYESGEDGDLLYLVMDCVDGQTLRDILRQRTQPLSPAEALNYLRPIAAALNYAHRQGIVHRDIKPGNILVDRNSKVFVSDFRIAKSMDSSTATLSTPGTPPYVAPEQWRGGSNVGPATDVYALGIMLYEMLTGRVPFRGDTVIARLSIHEKVRQEHLSAAPPRPSSLNPRLPRRFDDILLKCLEKDAARRYPSTDLLVQDFESACGLGRLSAQALRQSAPQWKLGSLPQGRVVAAIAALVVVVCLAALGLALFIGRVVLASPETGDAVSTPVVRASDDGLTTAPTRNGATPAPAIITAVIVITAMATDTIAPTITPTPTPTLPPSLTSTPTEARVGCSLMPSGAFVALWNRYQSDLGCPQYGSPRGINDAEQLFQNGHMFWRADIDAYYVIYDGGGAKSGNWSQYPGRYNNGGLSQCPNPAPEGYWKPQSGFGNVWCALGGATSVIGWGLDHEYGFAAGQGVRAQDFAQGVIFQDTDGARTGLVYILMRNGRFARERP